MDKVRVDKWLWAIRIFKSRTLASDVCKRNQVKVNGTIAKPSTTIEVGDTVEAKKEGFHMTYKVLKLLQKRVGAPVAVTCYEDLTPQEELDKFKDWYVGKANNERREKGAGRPTKRERRDIDKFKGY